MECFLNWMEKAHLVLNDSNKLNSSISIYYRTQLINRFGYRLLSLISVKFRKLCIGQLNLLTEVHPAEVL
jgi:hypothetical protein